MLAKRIGYRMARLVWLTERDILNWVKEEGLLVGETDELLAKYHGYDMNKIDDERLDMSRTEIDRYNDDWS
jgi:hypothetical protein